MSNVLCEPRKVIKSLDPSLTLARAYLLMQKGGHESLPVCLNGEVVGVLSMADVASTLDKYFEGRVGPGELTVGNFMHICGHHILR